MKHHILTYLLLCTLSICLSQTTISLRGTDGTISINDVSKNEGNPGLNVYIFLVTYTNPSGSNINPFTIDYATIDDTATAPSDYAPTSGVLNFNGNHLQTLNIIVFGSGDFNLEPDESFNVVLSNIQTTGGEDVSFSDDTGTGTLLNDDGSEITLSSQGNSQEVDGLEGKFILSASSVFSSPVTITFTIGGTSEEGTDYNTIGTSIVFPANTFNFEVPISPINDDLTEGDETVTMTLTGTNDPQILIGTPNQAIVTIKDDDSNPFVNPNQVFSTNEGASSETSIGLILATDFDSNTSFIDWTIVSGNIDQNMNTSPPFFLEATTGELKANDPEDLIEGAQFILGITVSDGTNTSAIETITVNVDATLSNPDIELSTFELYPNPSFGKVFIKGDLEFIQIEVYDLNGRRLLLSNGANKEIDLTELSSGIYLIVLQTRSCKFTRRVLKK